MKFDFDTAKSLAGIFNPYIHAHHERMLASDGRLVHYTSAASGLNILKTETLWLRNARNMHDFSEISYGHDHLVSYFQKPENAERFYAAIDKCHPGLGRDIVKAFDQNWIKVVRGSYISCFSEHDEREDDHGRLSMWRTFGAGTPSVALFFRYPKPHTAMPLITTLCAVSYSGPEHIGERLDQVIRAVQENEQMLKSVDRQFVGSNLYAGLLVAAVAVKHPAFVEEKEWRLIYNPLQAPSPYMKLETETINGVPQPVVKLPFKNDPDATCVFENVKGISGLTLKEIFDRMIIGPTQYAESIAAAFAGQLEQLGIDNPISRIKISRIPLRG